MKYAIIIPDGCADEPQQALDGKTPLQAARVPAMDAVAAAGVTGRADNVPPDLPAGSDVANLSLFGYDPLRCFTGRAPLEAAAQGIEFHRPLRTSDRLETAVSRLRERIGLGVGLGGDAGGQRDVLDADHAVLLR